MDVEHHSHRGRHHRSASGLTVVAHFFGILSTILMLVWLLHYREGLDLDSDDARRVFNVHPFLMFFGFIFMAGEAMMAYKTVRAEWQVRKFVHLFFHLVAIVLGIVGLHAAFKYHDQVGLTDMYSLHSWIGMGTFTLYCAQVRLGMYSSSLNFLYRTGAKLVYSFIWQWLLGIAVFLPRSSSESKARIAPWHVNGGRALLFMAVATALTGLMQKATSMRLQHQNEGRLINFLGISILLFGIAVDVSVALARYA
ncbi:probable transmembrane ascorbate ferrireductase 3 isoform X1 [Salvia miltiorrhiza]|uniref:probable transmembrane ascorbate ferrireductase 3 isoform X1 n=1 Tax=Salvia miltiorrhiza TaxID=226208 RepID=UPI0025AD9C54|nr:probable transmembrane ascorbate ferrireductase 3 isoform X1 [Salvia miltiorrhiza]